MPKFKNYLGILYKDSILHRRNLFYIFFQLLLPALQFSLACLAIGQEPFDLKFGIVNNETLFNGSGGNNKGSEMLVNAISNKTFQKVKTES